MDFCKIILESCKKERLVKKRAQKPENACKTPSVML